MFTSKLLVLKVYPMPIRSTMKSHQKPPFKFPWNQHFPMVFLWFSRFLMSSCSPLSNHSALALHRGHQGGCPDVGARGWRVMLELVSKAQKYWLVVSIEFLWNIMEYLWNIYMEYLWNMCGICMVISMEYLWYNGWLVVDVYLPLWKIWVNWDEYSQYMGKSRNTLVVRAIDIHEP